MSKPHFVSSCVHSRNISYYPALCCFLSKGNPADDLVGIINKNRTAQKLPELSNSPGLGCVALQYAEECQGNCASNNTINCHPSADDFTEVFAPNCGVELPTFGTISGYLIGCQHKDLTPAEAFSEVLIRDHKSLSLLGNRSHNDVGVGIFRAHKHKGPYLWCVLFSNSKSNTTFVLDDLGKGIKQKKGCYSGTGNPCSRANRYTEASYINSWTMVLLSFFFFQQFYQKL
ncbi:hypothetical protein ACH5RR_000480 [Cinchona calisaya]|uniref:Ferredoxin-like protein n=1 Tax=Cinchona calisaya TaxID=153742 RepID=A0ABD3B0X8_9GENT